MVITNNIDFYTYCCNKGVICTYIPKPTNIKFDDALIVVFTNNYHALSICGNRFNDEKKEDFEHEASELLDWFDVGDKVIMISNVNKFGTPYMRDNFELLQQRYDKFGITKQVINTKNIGSLINPHRMQLRYKNVKQIEFDYVRTDNIADPNHYWVSTNGDVKRQQYHYLNVLVASNDTEERRKMRYIPEYSLYSQLYKHLKPML